MVETTSSTSSTTSPYKYYFNISRELSVTIVLQYILHHIGVRDKWKPWLIVELIKKLPRLSVVTINRERGPIQRIYEVYLQVFIYNHKSFKDKLRHNYKSLRHSLPSYGRKLT